MTPKQKREEISKAYVSAVAASCGFKIASWSQDDDCVDITIGAPGPYGKGTTASPKLDLQLKCTNDQKHVKHDGNIAWQLKRAHYEILRARALVPKILVVLMLPEEEISWVEHSPETLIMRRCAYWRSLLNESEMTSKTDTTTVHLSQNDIFSPETLKELMEKISEGVPL